MSEKETIKAGNSLPQPPERGNEIRERPILFSGPMVRAILEGRKTMTRRVVKPQPHAGVNAVKWQDVIITGCNTQGQSGFAMMRGGVIESEAIRCPYGTPGDRLWVRETFGFGSGFGGKTRKVFYKCSRHDVPAAYCCDWGPDDPSNGYIAPDDHWRPSIHMPRWASRITLEITGVRVERLLEISEQDAIAEGVERVRYANDPHDAGFRDYLGDVVLRSARHSFETLWVKINGRESWDANPWVWVVEFRRVENGGCCESSTHQDEK